MYQKIKAVSILDTFLGRVAAHIIENHSNQTGNLAVVLPSRRAVTYLKKELPRQVEQTLWMPDIFSIEDFIFEASGFEEIDNTELILELFRVHREIKQENSATLDTFLSWAPVMATDFNTLDENLADAGQLFTFLSEAKAIEKWKPEKGKLTNNEKEYIHFFQLLKTYYEKLRRRLTEQKKAYPGMAIRTIFESNILPNHDKWQHYIFAGFYALTNAEEKIIQTLKQEGKVTQLYDADRYYTDNSNHEAGHFLRDKINQDHFRWLFDHYKSDDKTINVTAIPGNIGQSRKAGQLLDDISQKQTPLENTAVILADESLLLPVLNSLPDSINGVNVTMGFPIIHTSTASLVRLVIKIAVDKESYNRNTLHVNDFLQLINLPVVRYLIGDQNSLTRSLLKKNRALYQSHEIAGDLPHYIKETIDTFNSPLDLLDPLINLTKKIPDKESQDHAITIEKHSATYICDRLTELKKILEDEELTTTFNDLDKLIRKTVLDGSLPFSGEPMQGVQIMGMLESRAMDFENVILLSVNEGHMPAGKSYSSLIPFDIRKKFNLPTYRDNDSIYAYHFYRLLQRTQRTELVYNTEASTLGGNDQSRFIKQLKFELPEYNPGIGKISEHIQKPPFIKAEDREIIIPKTETVMEKIASALKSGEYTGLSASGLRSLVKCNLQYYFRYVLRLKKPEEVEETIPMDIFGNVIHKALEIIYKQAFSGPENMLDQEILDIDRNELDRQIVQILTREHSYSSGELENGRNRLMRDMAVNFIMKFTSREKEKLSTEHTEILDIEKELKHTLHLHGYEIHFRGFADRVDRVNGKTRIIDYKTGNIKPLDLKQNNDFETLYDLKTEEIIQVLFYDWLYSRMTGNEKERDGGIFLLTKPNQHSIFFNYNQTPGINTELREKFEKALMTNLEDLLNKDIPFRQTDDTKKCEHCDYRHICNR